MGDINTLNDLYASEQGEQLARKELLPLIKRFTTNPSPEVLEIGCAYGRNLVALSSLPTAHIVGCDIEKAQLAKAEERLKDRDITSVTLVHQTEENKLPFADKTFDVIVMWQLLEHILDPHTKKNILQEAVRLLKDQGILIVETPNQLFPIDYHDTNLPLIHWFFPSSWREWFIKKIRHADWPASQYINIFALRRWLKGTIGIKRIDQVTTVYFQTAYSDIFKHWGGTRLGTKKIFFILYFPFYLFLRLFRIPGDTFCPSLRAIFKVKK
jgi:SAM-dependent methyltransferase